MKKEGKIVKKELLISLMKEYPEKDIAHYHEHGDFFYYTMGHLERGPDYYWVEDKNDLSREDGMIQVTELIPFTPSYEEKCADCNSMVPGGEVRYRIPYNRCHSCLMKVTNNH